MAIAAAPGCGFGSNSGKPGPDAGLDSPGGPGDDGPPPDAPPAGNGVCYGPSGWQVCFGAAVTGQVQLQGALDTGSDARCLGSLPTSWTASQPPACIIVGDTITVGSTSVTGSLPLVLVAQTQITVMNVLDVASHRDTGAVGAGTASSADCNSFASAPSMGPPGGGGAGGGFMVPGGDGGVGNGVAGASTVGGGAAAAQTGAPTRLHGGCPGQPGGGGSDGDGGAGGGAVYLVSAGTLSIPGQIDVSGAGGKGTDARHGGGGGGSGGTIVLHAASITTTAATILIAAGGGGGGGSSGLDQSQQTAKGGDGHGPVLATPIASALGGTGGFLITSGFNGGDGGQGYPVPSNMLFKLTGLNGDIGAGGGGGGGGGGYIRSNRGLGQAAVSPAVDIKP